MDRSEFGALTQRNDALGYEARPTDAKPDAHSEPYQTGSEPRKEAACQQVARAERYRHRTARMPINLLGQGISPPLNPLAQRDLRVESLRALLS